MITEKSTCPVCGREWEVTHDEGVQIGFPMCPHDPRDFVTVYVPLDVYEAFVDLADAQDPDHLTDWAGNE